MIQDRPDLPEILRAVREFITSVLDALDDQARYHALCANHLLGIAERELALGPDLEAAALARRRAFLGVEGSPEALTARLCAAIRDGDCDTRWDETVALVLDEVIAKVKVTKPDHLEPMHR